MKRATALPWLDRPQGLKARLRSSSRHADEVSCRARAGRARPTRRAGRLVAVQRAAIRPGAAGSPVSP